MRMILAIWAYRGFLLGSVRREFESRYRNSLLGAAWTVINPLTMIVVYTVIFSRIMQAKLPGVDSAFGYSIYLCVGVLTWGLFTEIVSRLQSVFLENANLLKKISFPRFCLPVIVVLNALVPLVRHRTCCIHVSCVWRSWGPNRVYGCRRWTSVCVLSCSTWASSGRWR